MRTPSTSLTLTETSSPSVSNKKAALIARKAAQYANNMRVLEQHPQLEGKLEQLVKKIAGGMKKRLPPKVSDRISSATTIGRMDALGLAELDPEKPGIFFSYVKRRVRGAISDMLRNEDHVSRRHRQKIQAGRLPDVKIIQLESPDRIPDPSPSAENLLDTKRRIEMVRRAILNNTCELTDNEKRVLICIFEGKTQSGIAEDMKISRSRVCQIRKEAIEKLRTHFCGLGHKVSVPKLKSCQAQQKEVIAKLIQDLPDSSSPNDPKTVFGSRAILPRTLCELADKTGKSARDIAKALHHPNVLTKAQRFNIKMLIDESKGCGSNCKDLAHRLRKLFELD